MRSIIPTTDLEVTYMHLVDLRPVVTQTSSEAVDQVDNLWPTIANEMAPEETLWVFAPNTYTDTGCVPVGMEIGQRARQAASLTLKNIITRYTEPSASQDFANVYEEILFFVSDRHAYYFDKDPIRISHVYEGNEWGDREMGNSAYHDTEVRRYNPDGKDPGNVWLIENRDQTSGQTVDRTRPLDRSEAIRRCVRAGAPLEETVHLWGTDEAVTTLVEEEDRTPVQRELPVEVTQ